MAIKVELIEVIDAPMRYAAGDGYLAGEAPGNPSDPASPDGRFRIQNVPARGRVMVFERGTSVCVASTLSAADGTWRIGNLSREMSFTVLGFDDRGLQNAAVQDWIKAAAPV